MAQMHFRNKKGRREDDEGVISHTSSSHSHNERKLLTEPLSSLRDPQDRNVDEVGTDADKGSLQKHADSQARVTKRPRDPESMSTLSSERDHDRKRTPPPKTRLPDSPMHKDPDAVETLDPQSIIHEDILDDDTGHPPLGLLRDLETRAITTSQLIQEVKGIYTGLVLVEKKCIETVTQQAQNPTKLSKEQWQALITLHRTLLNEHHDFFLASHHPVIRGHELRELPARYAMPARMWRHGIHAFLELLRQRLPESLEHMLSFTYLAYKMMTLLMETLPDFLETWIECLGDLARYRIAIEEADLRDREIWANTVRTWYDKAADLSPNTGRIQHHLAVLARPNIVQQLFLYSKALVAAIPFRKASESILLLFNPLLEQDSAANSRYQPAYFNITYVAVLFKRRTINEFENYRVTFLSSLETHVARLGSRFKTQGVKIASSLFAMFDFGNPDNKLSDMLAQHQRRMKSEYCTKYDNIPNKLHEDFVVQDPTIIDIERTQYWSKPITSLQLPPSPPEERTFKESDEISSYIGPLLFQTVSDVASHIGNKNVVPFMHIVLAYVLVLTWIPGASIYIGKFIPWDRVVQFLNTAGRSGITYGNVESAEFPKSFSGNKCQLPEDFDMRGPMAFTYSYNPNLFVDDPVDEDERFLEQPSHKAPRVEKHLYAAIQLAEQPQWKSRNENIPLTWESDRRRLNSWPRFADGIVAHIGVLLSDTIQLTTSWIDNKNVTPFKHTVLARLLSFSWTLDLDTSITRIVGSRSYVSWLSTFYLCHIPVAFAAPVIRGELDST